jgi:hypothetical protein
MATHKKTTIKQIKYSKSMVGTQPHNALCDIAPQDQAYYFDQLVTWLHHISEWGQYKDPYGWEMAQRRRPKELHIGQHGPNSIITMVAGLLCNYIHNHKKYHGVCRISERQMADFKWISEFMHGALGESSPPVQWIQCLFDQDGTQF